MIWNAFSASRAGRRQRKPELTRTITLTEYEPSTLPPAAMPEADGSMLWRLYDQRRGVLRVEFPSPKTGDQWRLTPQGWVGHIPLTPDLHFHLQPKVSVHNLFRMLDYAYRLRSFDLLDGLVESDSLNGFYERLAQALAQRVLARGRRGFHRAYLSRVGALSTVRGRLEADRMRPWDPRLYCRYEEQTRDVADNQILAWTLRRIAQSGFCSERVQPIVRRAYRSLLGVATPIPFSAEACVERLYNRLNEDYRPLHVLCRFFLEHTGPGHRLGNRPMLSFLINMARLYELFVAEWLRAHLPAPWTVKVQERVTVRGSGGNQDLRFDLDLVLYDGDETARLVLDTKYKAGERVEAADVNQIVTYAQARGCREAALVYPDLPGRPLDATVGDVRVRALRFGLDGDLDSSGEALLEQL